MSEAEIKLAKIKGLLANLENELREAHAILRGIKE